MSFVEAIYSFRIDLTHTERSGNDDLRFKVPKHPNETMEELLAHVLALTHFYRSGVELSKDRLNPDSPTAFRMDLTGGLLDWMYVGAPEGKLLKRCLRISPRPRLAVYFINQEQVTRFCRELRGSTENWVEHVEFWLLPEALLTELAPQIRSRVQWGLTYADEQIYLSWEQEGPEESRLFEGQVVAIDIWSEFQRSIEVNVQSGGEAP
jgi:uncharacterized protein YaeQ